MTEASRGGQGRCPNCGKPAVMEHRPFCSRRCADVDLSRWLRGGYAIPGRADTEEDGAEAAETPPEEAAGEGDGSRNPRRSE